MGEVKISSGTGDTDLLVCEGKGGQVAKEIMEKEKGREWHIRIGGRRYGNQQEKEERGISGRTEGKRGGGKRLAVVGYTERVDDTEVISFLLSTEIIPLCLRKRFYAVGRVLGNMVGTLVEQPSCRLLKHIIRCYLRLSDNQSACEALRTCLPDILRDATFSGCLREDPTARRWLQQLLHNIGVNRALQGGGGFDHMMQAQ
ncbi:CCR4-NOT transcription complex subunit 9, partial [Mucuna pruriens]